MQVITTMHPLNCTKSESVWKQKLSLLDQVKILDEKLAHNVSLIMPQYYANFQLGRCLL